MQKTPGSVLGAPILSFPTDCAGRGSQAAIAAPHSSQAVAEASMPPPCGKGAGGQDSWLLSWYATCSPPPLPGDVPLLLPGLEKEEWDRNSWMDQSWELKQIPSFDITLFSHNDIIHME